MIGRDPQSDPPISAGLQTTFVKVPTAAEHTSRTALTIEVGSEVARIRFSGAGEARLSSLFDAPAGARRVTLSRGMVALLDEGENQLVLLRGAVDAAGRYTDLELDLDIEQVDLTDPAEPPTGGGDPDSAATSAAPTLEQFGREWFVALALAEPWLVGQDDYPRPPSNREIYERVAQWNTYAWNLVRPQRVDDAIKIISRLAFGRVDDPFTRSEGRSQNVRFAVGRRAAEVRLVTPEDLAQVQRKATERAAERAVERARQASRND
ncbi:hypothetical protein [Nakamurella lactea]|uniref:hypothetical protein n=1 Tax=Nakamurella lactea TaxID=459515 RepID=UPI001B7F8250|nr:hypothetical protein [Nakamurella lactea]